MRIVPTPHYRPVIAQIGAARNLLRFRWSRRKPVGFRAGSGGRRLLLLAPACRFRDLKD
jgi:hypothetical protein